MDDSIKNKPNQKTKQEFEESFLNFQTCEHCREKYMFDHVCEGVIQSLISRKKLIEKRERLSPEVDYSADWFELWEGFKAVDRRANAAYCETRYNFYIKRNAEKEEGGSFFPWQDQKDIGD